MTAPRVSVRRIVGTLPRRERRATFVLFVLMLVAAVCETAGVASILPFMAVVTDPGTIERSPALVAALAAGGVHSERASMIVIGVLVLAVLIGGNAASAAGQWVQQRMMARIRRGLSTELFAGYLRQPYTFHVQHDAPSLLKVVFDDVDAAIHYLFTPLLGAGARAVVVLGLLLLIMLLDPVIAASTLLVVGAAYLAVYRLVRGRQIRWGSELNRAREQRHRAAIEGLGGIKELIILGREAEIARRFDEATAHVCRTTANNTLTGMVPRYVLEAVAFGGIVFVTLAVVLREGNSQSVIPTLALYAMVGYRLLPAVQQIFASAVTLRFGGATLESLERHLRTVRTAAAIAPASEASPARSGHGDVVLDGLSFTYPGANRPALRDLSLVIGHHQTVGLVGRTGSGKTTLVDLLLGLYEPGAGSVTVGGVRLSPATARRWRQRVGYVPQSVFLGNATVAQNIAFAVPDREIDRAAVQRAATMAQADDFISQLPQGFETVIGERGVKLSGGQRQRLGIARALYHSPDVLVFDEATSALDGLTEEAVMDAIRSLAARHTIILIAHRLRTVEACDRILLLEDGRVVADGSYTELLRHSPEFRRLAGPSAAQRPVAAS